MNPTTPSQTPTPAAPLYFQDEGYFGPQSLSWRLALVPATALAATAAAMVQMLLPPVIYVIDQASSFYRNPALRAQLTGEFYLTAQFGDTITAENAGASLWKIHGMKHATNSATGKQVNATDPDLLLWVHNTVVWCELRAYERYGPALTPPEQDRYIEEQKTIARLSRVDVSRVPSTYPELDAYVTGMTPQLELTAEAARFRDLIVTRGVRLNMQEELVHLAANAAVDLLLPEQQLLYGFDFSDLYRESLRAFMHVVFELTKSKEPLEKQFEAARAHVAAKPFGNRAVLYNQEMTAELERDKPA